MPAVGSHSPSGFSSSAKISSNVLTLRGAFSRPRAIKLRAKLLAAPCPVTVESGDNFRVLHSPLFLNGSFLLSQLVDSPEYSPVRLLEKVRCHARSSRSASAWPSRDSTLHLDRRASVHAQPGR